MQSLRIRAKDTYCYFQNMVKLLWFHHLVWSFFLCFSLTQLASRLKQRFWNEQKFKLMLNASYHVKCIHKHVLCSCKKWSVWTKQRLWITSCKLLRCLAFFFPFHFFAKLLLFSLHENVLALPTCLLNFTSENQTWSACREEENSPIKYTPWWPWCSMCPHLSSESFGEMCVLWCIINV